MNIVIGEGLELTEIFESDLQNYLDYLNDPLVCKFVSQIPFPYTEKDFQNWLEFIASEKAKHGKAMHFAIRKDGKLIGGTGITGIYGHVASTGSWLGTKHCGQGIGTKVKKVFNEFIIKEFDLKRIEAYVFKGNTASQKMLEKCGFTLEGDLKNYYFHRGEFYNKLIFGLCL